MKMYTSKRFYITFIIILILKQASAQPGYDPGQLPHANEYTLKNWFDLNTIGSQLPFDERAAKIFADNVELSNLNLIWHATPSNVTSVAKHLLIIANSIKLGRENTVDLESFYLPKALREGCSIILLCRKLIIGPESKLNFTGATGGPELFVANIKGSKTINAYLGGYGSQLLIAPEQIDVDRSTSQQLDSSYFNAAMKFFSQRIGVAISDPSFLAVKQDLLSLLDRYKGILPSEEVAKYALLLKGSELVDSATINTFMHLIEFQIQDLRNNDILALFSNYDNDRTNYNSDIVIPGKPFTAVQPFLQSHLLTAVKYNALDSGNFPITIRTTFAMHKQKHVVTRFPIPLITFEAQFPCTDEVFGARTGYDALRTLSTDCHNLFSQWAVEWIKYRMDSIGTICRS